MFSAIKYRHNFILSLLFFMDYCIFSVWRVYSQPFGTFPILKQSLAETFRLLNLCVFGPLSERWACVLPRRCRWPGRGRCAAAVVVTQPKLSCFTHRRHHHLCPFKFHTKTMASVAAASLLCAGTSCFFLVGCCCYCCDCFVYHTDTQFFFVLYFFSVFLCSVVILFVSIFGERKPEVAGRMSSIVAALRVFFLSLVRTDVPFAHHTAFTYNTH